jgi:hypothetical protein
LRLSAMCRGIVLGIGLLLSTFTVVAETSDASVEAVWKPQRATFVYAGHTTFYTCSALEQKLTLVLRVIGAHDDIEFDRRECKTHGTARLHVRFKSPIEATAENIRAITTYDGEQALTARLNGIHLPTAEDLERFPASWKEVSFAGDRRLRLSAADCEFVDHVRRQLLPHLAARVITNRIFCTPGAHAIRPPRFVISTLVADVK